MKKNIKFVIFIIFLTFLFFILGCAQPKISLSYKVPPEVDIGVKRIAIVPLDEKYSRKISNILISNLSQMGYFEILEREKLDMILQEAKLSLSGLMDVGKAVELGRLAGVEGLVLVSVDDFNFQSEKGIDEIDVPSRKYRNVTYKIKIPKITIKAYLSCSFRVISVATSQIIVSRTFSEKFEDEYYQNPKLENVPSDETLAVTIYLLALIASFRNPPSQGEILDNLSQKVATSIVKTISPYFEKLDVVWEDLKIKEQERIISLLNAGLIGDALDEFLKLKYVIEAKNDKKLLASYYYDLGIIYEILGDLNSARECYTQALKLDPTNNHSNAVKRINQRLSK